MSRRPDLEPGDPDRILGRVVTMIVTGLILLVLVTAGATS